VQNVVDKIFLKSLGNKVREIRLQHKISQEELGFRVGNSGKQIGRVERGEHNVSTCMIFAIAKAIDVPVKDFFDF